MRIQKADKLGLCFGVGRAIKLLKEAAGKYGGIETLGPVAHNRLLVERLGDLGVRSIGHVEQARGKILAITTHGTSPDVLSEIKARHTCIIDTTCPIVRKAQKAASELAEAGFDMAFPWRRATHEFIVTLKRQTHDYNATAMDYAKRLLDFGYHAPTTYFPLLVPECLLIEPTETESKEELDGFVEAMKAIDDEARTQVEKLKGAPYTLPVRRLDDVKAAKELDLKWTPPENNPHVPPGGD